MTVNFNKLSVQQFFPVSPEYLSWEDWNGEFIVYYGQENIPHNSEEDWQKTANTIASSPTFSAYPVPTAQGFETWQEWAKEVTTIINGKAY
jgi:hypothetical protein